VLTETELKIMTIIWLISEGTVHDVIEKLGNDYAYNTVSTIVRVLEQKGFVQSRKEGRSHFYSAKIKKEEYETIGLDNVVDGLFGGTPVALVKRLIDSGKLSKEDVKELKDLLK
jgi:predicted transcriptional regulator